MQRYDIAEDENSAGEPCMFPAAGGDYVLHSEAQARIETLEAALRDLMRSYEAIVRGERGGFNETAYPEWEQARKALGDL